VTSAWMTTLPVIQHDIHEFERDVLHLLQYLKSFCMKKPPLIDGKKLHKLIII